MTVDRSRAARCAVVACAAIAAGCAHPAATTPTPARATRTTYSDSAVSDVTQAPAPSGKRPYLPPQAAMLYGLLPINTTGADAFRSADPSHDGRGVLIGILDSGIDGGVPGMRTTTTGAPKLVDLRDFSGEGSVALERVTPDAAGDATIDGVPVRGFARVAGLASPPYFGGLFRERPLGQVPAADVNGDGDADDAFPVVVARASDGWFALFDTDGDGSLANERPVHDYAMGRELVRFGTGPLTVAVNLSDSSGVPTLDLVFDNSGHGTHVGGIAAGHDLFGVSGFDGVAPGAQLLGLKIANDARGGISVGGSMIRAMNYAAEFAERRGLPLVLNMSFGIGNEQEGTATIDSAVDAFLVAHPSIVFVISAGNDGPGVSTVGMPGSADFVMTACALFPGIFAKAPQPGEPAAPDVVGWWSSRGGEVQKPDLCTPGVAFSNVPPWDTGEEVEGGTSMAAPQLAGAAALLESAMAQDGRTIYGPDIKRALIATATPIPGSTVIDVGTGVPNIPEAYRWLRADHQAGRYAIRALADGGNTSTASAAYRRDGLASAGDTVQRFVVTPVHGQPAARLILRPDVAWIGTPQVIDFAGGPDTVTLTYDPSRFTTPGLYVGTVWARPESDTLAGAAFGLTNTVVVPESLRRPVTSRRAAAPGSVTRYFLTVPSGAGGLDVSLHMSGLDQGTLFLFEPNGQPARTAASIEVGGNAEQTGEIAVAAGDVVPGVYEADVVAPPLDSASFTLDASVPPIRITPTPIGASLTSTDSAMVAMTVRAQLIGAARTMRVSGTGSARVSVPADAPAWATTAEVDVQLPPASWSAFTDFGVTLFDADGRLIGDEPLNYAFGRARIALDSLVTRRVSLELAPAFALPDSHQAWTADVTLRFLADSGTPALVNGFDSTQASLAAGTSRAVAVALADSTLRAPSGFVPLFEVIARPQQGATAHGRLTLTQSPPGLQR